MAGLWEQATTLVDDLGDDDWVRPVPWTPAWTVADLVSHLGGLQSALNGDPQPEPPRGFQPPSTGSPFDQAMAGPIEARRSWDPQHRRDELHRAATAHVAALGRTSDWLEVTDGPAGPTTHDGLFHIRAFDVWVHLQDLAEALGQPVGLGDTSEGAAACHNYVLGLVPWLFGKRAAAPEGATLRVTLGPPLEHDSVLRVTAGRATWDPTADPGDCFVEGLPAGLTLLVTGRGTPRRWRDEGALDWGGGRGEEFAERARMF
jgi:uncharacterized protein (TIGR03083 family)